MDSVKFRSTDIMPAEVSVTLAGSGSYTFIFDTGAQISIMEPSLAAELKLSPAGSIDLASGFQRSSVRVVSTTVSLGARSVGETKFAVQSMARYQDEDRKVRGVLGQDFLEHFDVLIDRQHKAVCLDTTGKLSQAIHGERFPMVSRPACNSYPTPILLSAKMNDTAIRPVILMLDSGANWPLIYTAAAVQASARYVAVSHNELGASRSDPNLFTFLRPQEVRIGSTLLPSVVFANTIQHLQRNKCIGEDGLLPTALFDRVFISYSGRYVVLNPR